MPLGIENLKRLLKVGLNLGQELAKDLEDKKISFFEVVGLVPDIFNVVGVVKSWADVKQEIADLSPEETKELEEYVMSEFNIPNAKVKVFINHAIMQVVSLVALVDEFKHIHDAEEQVTGGIETPPPPPNP